MQEGRNLHFTDFGIFAYFYFSVSDLQWCEILMKCNNDNPEKRQGVCAKFSQLDMQEMRT